VLTGRECPAGRTSTSFDDQHAIKGTDLAGRRCWDNRRWSQRLHGQVCEEVITERRAIPWTEVKPEINTLNIVPVPRSFSDAA